MKSYSIAIRFKNTWDDTYARPGHSLEYPAYDIWKNVSKIEYLDSLTAVFIHGHSNAQFFFEPDEILAVHESETPYFKEPVSGLLYTESERVVRFVEMKPRPNPYVQGYGAAIPLIHGIIYKGLKGNHLHRIYLMNYSNNGSLYINIQGKTVFLDSDTQNKVRRAARRAARKPQFFA